MTERSFRRHRLIAEQVLACRASGNECPDVRNRGNGVHGGALGHVCPKLFAQATDVPHAPSGTGN